MGNSNDMCCTCENVIKDVNTRDSYMIQKNGSDLSLTAPCSSSKRVSVIVKTNRNISSIQVKQNQVQNESKPKEVNLNVSKKNAINQKEQNSITNQTQDDNLQEIKSIFIKSVSSLKDVDIPLSIMKKDTDQNPQSPKLIPERQKIVANPQQCHKQIIHFDDQASKQSRQSDFSDFMLTLDHVQFLQSRIARMSKKE